MNQNIMTLLLIAIGLAIGVLGTYRRIKNMKKLFSSLLENCYYELANKC